MLNINFAQHLYWKWYCFYSANIVTKKQLHTWVYIISYNYTFIKFMKLKEHVHRDQEHFLYYLTSFIYQLQNPYSNISNIKWFNHICCQLRCKILILFAYMCVMWNFDFFYFVINGKKLHDYFLSSIILEFFKSFSWHLQHKNGMVPLAFNLDKLDLNLMAYISP